LKKQFVLGIILALILLPFAGETIQAESVNRGGVVNKTASVQGVIVRNFNPFSPNALHSTYGGFYETLVFANTIEGDVEPWLAQEFYWEDDLQTLIFELEEDVYWNDGEKFTANDVEFTLSLGREHDAIHQAGIWDQGLTEVNALDDYTVEFKFDEVNTTVLADVGGIYIVPEHIWSDVEDPVEFENDYPVGTGPFMYEEGSFTEMSYSLERNPDYWQLGEDGEPLPYIDGVQYKGATGNEQASMMIITGEVDWGTYFIPNIDRNFVQRDPENHHYWLPEGNLVYLNLNNERWPFENRNVRRALAKVLDKERMTEVMGSGAIPAPQSGVKSAFDDWVPESAQEQKVDVDVVKARELLEEEGFSENDEGTYVKDGEELSFELYVPSGWTDWINAAENIATQLELAGINIDIEQVAWPSPFNDNIINGDYKMSFSFTDSGISPFYQFDNILPSRHYAPVGEEATNDSQVRYRNDLVDEAFDGYRKSDDPDEQMEYMQTILDEFIYDMPMIPLFFNPTWFQYNTSNFVGWPNEDDPYALPHTGGMDKMQIFLNLQPTN